MLVNQNTVSVQGNLDALKTQKFGIECNSVAFDVWMNGLYSDKIGTIIRELLCNARDSHKQAGTLDTKIDVHLPDSLVEPYFSIRDYGVGLSEQAVFDIYTVFFKSTKRESNAMIGGFGLGSKTPFSYVDSFNVTSWFDGVKTEYLVYKDASGFPTITKVVQVKSDEHNGLEVKFGVKDTDAVLFVRKLSNFLSWSKGFNCNVLNKHPSVVLSNGIKETLFARLDKIDTDVYSLDTSRNDKIRVGGVCYEIPYSIVSDLNIDSFVQKTGKPSSLKENAESKFSLFVEKCLQRFMFDFPVGFIDVTASREKISFTENTKTNLLTAFAMLYDKWVKMDLTVKSLKDFCKRADFLCQTRSVGIELTIPEKMLPFYKPHENFNTDLMLNIENIVKACGAYDHKELRVANDNTFRFKTNSVYLCFHSIPACTFHIIVADCKVGIQNVVCKTDLGTRYILVKTNDAKSTYEYLTKTFGCEFFKVSYLSSFEKVDTKKKEKTKILEQAFTFVNPRGGDIEYRRIPENKAYPVFYIPYSTQKNDYESLSDFFSSFNFSCTNISYFPERRGFYKLSEKIVNALKTIGYDMVDCSNFTNYENMPTPMKKYVKKAVLGHLLGTKVYNGGMGVGYYWRRKFEAVKEIKNVYEYAVYRRVKDDLKKTLEGLTYEKIIDCAFSDCTFHTTFHLSVDRVNKKVFLKKLLGELLDKTVKIEETDIKQLLKGTINEG